MDSFIEAAIDKLTQKVRENVLFNASTRRYILRSPKTGRYDAFMSCKQDDVVTYLIHHLEIPPKEAKKLLKQPGIITPVAGVDIFPFRKELVRMEGVGYLNIWVPHDLKPQAHDWKSIERLLKRLTVSEEGFNWFMDFLAWRLQKPTQPAMVAPIFITNQGSGKGTLHKLLEVIWGKENCRLLQANEVNQQFNSELFTGKLLLTLDEVSKIGDERKDVMDLLKHYITGDSLRVEAKYQPASTIPNRITWLLFTNTLAVLPLEESDRRFTVFADKRNNKTDGWMEWVAETFWDGPEFKTSVLPEILGFWHDLSQRDVSAFKPHPLDNEARRGLIRASASSMSWFTNAIKEAGSFEDFYLSIKDEVWSDDKCIRKDNIVEKMSLFSVYKKFSQRAGFKSKNVANFWHEIPTQGVKVIKHNFSAKRLEAADLNALFSKE